MPLLLVAAVGLWLWKGGSLQKRHVFWLFPLEERPQITQFTGSVAESDDNGGWETIKREEQDFPAGGAPSQVEWEVPLNKGKHRFVGTYRSSAGNCFFARELDVEEEQVSIVFARPGTPDCGDGSRPPE